MKYSHYTHNYLLAPPHELTVSLIGCGGTGSQVLTALGRMNYALRQLGHPGLLVTAYDGDPDPGISWTLDEQWCRGYAKAKGRRVKQMQVSRDQVFAYVSRRGEEEVIVL